MAQTENGKPKLKVVMTGGGTAGHIMPCVALIEELSGECELHYIGRHEGMERDIIGKIPHVIYHGITAVKLVRSLTPINLAIPFKLLCGVRQASKILKKIKPDIVFSKGGYVALPVTIAAKCPIICHESDRSVGLANHKAVKKAVYFCTSFPETARTHKNGVFTGSPIRKSLFLPKKIGARPMLLIMGGSLGAKAINDCVSECIDALTQKFDVVHITGRGKHTNISHSRYKQLEFCDNIGELYAEASVVLSRGGGSALFELAALKIPSVIIPLCGGVSRGDQVENAAYFANQKLCRVLPQSELTPEKLLSEINVALTDTDMRRALANAENINGTKLITSLIMKAATDKQLL